MCKCRRSLAPLAPLLPCSPAPLLPVIIFLPRSLVQSPKAHIHAALFHLCYWKCQHSNSVGGGHWFTDAEDHYNANKVMSWLAHHAWKEEYEEEAKPPASSPRRSRSRSPWRPSESSNAMDCYWKAWQNYQAKCSSAARDLENDVEGLFQ